MPSHKKETGMGLSNQLQYIPRNMHTVFALLCFVVVIHWLIFPYPSGLLHWHCSASKATLMNMDKYFMWIHYEQLRNHNKAKHNKTVCIFLGIYSNSILLLFLFSKVIKRLITYGIACSYLPGDINKRRVGNPHLWCHSLFVEKNRAIHLIDCFAPGTVHYGLNVLLAWKPVSYLASFLIYNMCDCSVIKM